LVMFFLFCTTNCIPISFIQISKCSSAL
jgi:hypothetical protein